MNKLIGRIVPAVSLVVIFVLGYYANSIGVLSELSKEIQRYSGLTSRHLMFVATIVGGSFIFGYLFTRVSGRRTV